MDGPVYACPAITLIAQVLGPFEAALFIDGGASASDIGLLRQHQITTVLNRAVNLDINHVQAHRATAEVRASGYGDIRINKVGIIDGEGSPGAMVLDACHILDGALRQTIPKREIYPFPDGGNVLASCRSGRRRSVSPVASLLHKQPPHFYQTLDHALAAIGERRELAPDDRFETPKSMLYDAIRRASDWIELIEARKQRHS
ncbi:protein phosphatase [Rhizobium sp. BR 314]|uniref:protein phosphatase n=1 Tax=Rhizobium sp. BR 314 TaxID=3040013 RepID=UPI0039BFF52F